MMSSKGMEILAEIYAQARADYLQDFPGANENDVERYFLILTHFGVMESFPASDLSAKIEQIR